MILFRWLIAIVFGAFGSFILFVNFRILYVWLLRREHHSGIPFVGGLFLFAGMAFCPVLLVRKHAWAPLAFDFAYWFCILTMGLLLTWWGKKKKDAS